ncbi:hypothetical protein ACS0TY_021148 [Phlomoides rotata]
MRKKIKVEAEMVVVLIAMFLLGSSIELANCKYMGWSLKVTQEMAFQLSWLDTGLLSLVSFLDRHWEPNLKPLVLLTLHLFSFVQSDVMILLDL